MDNLISIIIPVYKVEKYLNQCIESIVHQTYENLEIILVDDGSPDKCPQLCDEWANKDNRIKVIHKQNEGLSAARNSGMQIASGDYIGFVDSDDWISLDMYELLLHEMEKTHSDISACGVKMVWDDGKNKMLTRDGCIVLNNKQAMRALIEETWIKQPVWYKLYKSKLIKDILFERGKYHEDVYWSYKAIANVNKICIFDTPCYYYRQRPDSIMSSEFSEKKLDSLEAMIERLEFLNINYPELSNEAKVITYFYCMYLMQWALKENQNRVALDIINLAKKIEPNIMLPKLYKEKLWVLLSKISFTYTCRLRNILKIGI